MRVEIVGKRLKDSGYNLVQGDTVTVEDEIAKVWCDRGWAKDVDGEYAGGERKPGAQRVAPANVKIKGGVSNG